LQTLLYIVFVTLSSHITVQVPCIVLLQCADLINESYAKHAQNYPSFSSLVLRKYRGICS